MYIYKPLVRHVFYSIRKLILALTWREKKIEKKKNERSQNTNQKKKTFLAWRRQPLPIFHNQLPPSTHRQPSLYFYPLKHVYTVPVLVNCRNQSANSTVNMACGAMRT